MQQAQANVEDLKLDAERRLTCKGSALVRFEYFRWNEYVKRNEAKRRPEQEHINRVKRIFQKAGCRPLELRHHIPAIVTQQQVEVALQDAQQKGRWKSGSLPSNYAIISTQDGYPELEFSSGIECLHGLHRIEAGKQWLQPTQKWWIVDLYISDISYELKTVLTEEYSNDESPCDGEIYRKIREYQFMPRKIDCQISPATCVSFEMLWWARFHKSREKKLRALFSNREQNRRLAAGFDALSKIPGLFDAGMMVTTLNKVTATKCYEELIHYLEYIRIVWKGFFRGIERGFQRVDKTTVNSVELRAPGVSTIDAHFLGGQVLSGVIFTAFNAHEREIIWGNIVAFNGIIPSLSKFFQDVHLLEACINALRWLFTVPSDKTVFTVLGELYTQRETQPVQTNNTTFRFETGNRAYCMRLGYLQLIAFAMRENKDLPKAPPAKLDLKEMPRAKASREVLERFASFAELSGFNSPEIEMLKGVWETPQSADTLGSSPICVTTGPGAVLKQRCGLPRANSFREDSKYLYLDNLYREDNGTGEGVTSFFVLKCWFIAFFGPWPNRDASIESTSPQPPVDHSIEEDADDLSMAEVTPSEPRDNSELGQDMGRIIEEEQKEVLATTEEQQEIVMQQVIEEPLVESGRTLQEEENTLFGMSAPSKSSSVLTAEPLVPADPKPQKDANEVGNMVTIRFVDRESSEIDMLDPFQTYKGQRSVDVERGDPKLLIPEVVEVFLHQTKKRTRDRWNRFIPAEECYNIATKPENNNTIFLVPDIGYNQGNQLYEIPEIRSRAHEELQKEEQSLAGNIQAINEQEELFQFEDQQQETQVPGSEKDNAVDSHILTVHFKQRVEDSQDNSKPARDLTWVEVQSIDVPHGDPNGLLRYQLENFWHEARLKPCDQNLRILEYGDCYKVAMEAHDHTLYLMAQSSQTEEERAAEHTWSLPPPLKETPSNKQIHVSPQAQEDTPFKDSPFNAPPHIPTLPHLIPSFQRPSKIRSLVSTTGEDVHWNKIAKGRDKSFGTSSQEEAIMIMKGRKKTFGESSQEAAIEIRNPKQNRKLIKLRKPEARTALPGITEEEPEEEW